MLVEGSELELQYKNPDWKGFAGAQIITTEETRAFNSIANSVKIKVSVPLKKTVQKLWEDNNEKLSTILKLKKTNSVPRVFLYISRKGPSTNYLNYKMFCIHFIHCECTVENFPKHQCTYLCLLNEVLSKTIFLLLEQNMPSYLREV